MQHRRLLPFVAAIGVATIATCLLGCPGDLESPGRFDAQFGACPDIEADIIQKDCAKSFCHKPPNLMGSLDLSQPDVITRLSGKMAVGGDGKGLLIDPTNPEDSVLYTKITSNPPFGAQMPLSGAKLDLGVQQCFLSWIEDSVGKGTTK